MEAQTDIQAYLEQGKQALAQGQGREAAIAYAHAAQIEPNNPMVHLGLAEANLALGSYGVVYMAARKVQDLQPEGGVESTMAKALLNLLDRRYDRALQDVDAAISQDPGTGYAHALRSYLLRATGHDYDAQLARARAARLSYGGHFDDDFPPLESTPSGYRGIGSSNGAGTAQPNEPYNGQPAADTAGTPTGAPIAEPVPTWSRPNGMQRQMIRTRFALSQRPRIVTYALIAINFLVYIVLAVLSQNFINIDTGVLVQAGAQVNILVQQGQYWRIFTAMFLHFSILHIGLNMLSLFFIGPAIEVFYGKWRYLVVYLVSGIIGGILTYFTMPPNTIAAGASGAIFGIFGALGVFFFANRRVLGGGIIGQWIFWLALNIVWDFSNPSIGIWDHLGGLIAGIILGFILMPRLRPRRRTS